MQPLLSVFTIASALPPASPTKRVQPRTRTFLNSVLIRRVLDFALPLLMLHALAFAATDTRATGRPKIGLVLNGGGALGLAHIGVLQWLEDHRIPVDYVAGTSMGGLIGGVYATGMRPAEVRRLVDTIDWDQALRGQTPFEALSFRRKQDALAYPNYLELGLRNGLSLPTGLNSGQQINLIIDRAVLPYSHLRTFDELPIPFRCVAADLVTAQKYVFKEGSIAEAMRATMSLPGFFEPVRKDGRIFVDGGILDNLPVDVAQDMGADIVIAVYLDPGPFDPNSPLSFAGVLRRSIGVTVAANEFASMQKADILVSVNLAEYTATDYRKAEEITARGYEAAGRKSNILSRFALDESTWREHIARRESRKIPSVPPPRFIEVRGTTPNVERDIRESLAGLTRKPIDFPQLEQELTRVAGSGRFSSLQYHLTETEGVTGLLIVAEEKPYAPPLLKPGFEIDGSAVDDVRFTAGARITALDVGGLGSEWRTDLAAGATYAATTEYYRPLKPSAGWFIAPRAFASSSPFDLYSRDTRIAYYRFERFGGGFDVGYGFNRFSELRIGYESGWLNTKLRTGNPVLPTLSGRTGTTSLRYTLNKLDSPVVPRSGDFLAANAQWVDANPGTTSGFPAAEARTGYFRQVSRPGSVFLLASGGTTFGHDRTGLPQFSLGGPTRLAAYGLNELLTNQYFLFRAGYLHQVGELPPLIGNKAYVYSAYEIGKAYGPHLSSRLPTDVTAGIIIETLFGPFSLGGAIGDTGHRKWYFQLGRFF